MAKPIVDLVAGARPNFMKLAPVFRQIRAHGRFDVRIVHTGQHYDASMSSVFFRELGLPEPDVHLRVGSGTHAEQTARILERYAEHVAASSPAATVVFGDINSTVACALAAVKLGVRVAHVEAGLRSFDRTMPEEINRILTDAMADLLLVSEPSGVANLRREGVSDGKIRLVGNVMIDTMLDSLPRARARDTATRLGLTPRAYGLVTLHRPSNVDDPHVLRRLLDVLRELSSSMPLVFPTHPRTKAVMVRHGFGVNGVIANSRLMFLEPQPYLDHISLMADASVVLTDSGGMQEETAVLGIPCLTLRENTERPVTIELGTSRLVGNDPRRVRAAFTEVLEGAWPLGGAIPLWDGRAGERVANELASWLGV